MPRPKSRKLVVVHWSDAWIDTDNFYTEDEVDLLKDSIRMVTAGILVRKTKKVITVALDWHKDERTFRSVQSIPLCNVAKIVEYPIGE